jgi:hypothetical protein
MRWNDLTDADQRVMFRSELRQSAPTSIAQREVEDVIRRMTK